MSDAPAASTSTFSEHWYRVAGLHPRLKSHVQLARHVYRGEVWYALKDGLSGRQHRLNHLAYQLVGRFDGSATLQQVWEHVVRERGDAAPTQPEVIALLAQLHRAELIQTEMAPDLQAVFENRRRSRRRSQRARQNPLALRVALMDPTRLLNWLVPIARALSALPLGALWLVLVLLGVAVAALHCAELEAYARLNLGAPQMLVCLWVAFPLVKACHELAHALAVRVWGGEVREFGITLMVLMPVPYVDASAAASFSSRGRRVMVSLVGVACELALAAVAVLLWSQAADGWVRQFAFAVAFIGSVSTLIFNGNPLMPFDAYHALADAIDSPGLGPRSRAYWLYLARRHLLGVATATPPAVARGERPWLLGYGAAALVFRWLVTVAVLAYLLALNLFLGTLALIWMAVGLLGRPVWGLVRHVMGAPDLEGRRLRASSLGALALALPVLAVVGLPVPVATRAEGVVWLPEQALVRSQGDGFVEQVLVRDGEQVSAGQPLVQLRDPGLELALQRSEARLRGLEAAYHMALFNQTVQAQSTQQELLREQAEQARITERLAAQTLRAGRAGRMALAQADDLPQTFVARGTVLAHVLAPGASTVRVLIAEDDVARLHQRPGQVSVRLADASGHSLVAEVGAQAPAAVHELPSPLLAAAAGGPFATDPQDPRGLRTLQPLFSLDLTLPQWPVERIGTRAVVRFDHGHEPLGLQWLRRMRQLFIGQAAPRVAGQGSSAAVLLAAAD
jgi:putative peptide zinc metalloprotease protein